MLHYNALRLLKLKLLAGMLLTLLFTTACTPTPLLLPSSGTWLLLATSHNSRTLDGIYAVEPSGENLTQLVGEVTIVSPYSFGAAVSPQGEHIAYITADNALLHNLTLHLLTLPEGKRQTITPLTQESTAPPTDAPNISGEEYLAAYAIGGLDRSFEWSPDGRQLAFISAHDSPSADVYLYDTVDDSITRLTTEPEQAILPHWSPDGETILYMTYETFIPGQGPDVTAVRAVTADGSDERLLYLTDDPLPTEEELFITWLDADHFLIYSRDIACGWRSLRVVDLP